MSPAQPAASAATASPSGHRLRWLPTGAVIIGMEILLPSTVVERSTDSNFTPLVGFNSTSVKGFRFLLRDISSPEPLRKYLSTISGTRLMHRLRKSSMAGAERLVSPIVLPI